MGTDIVIPAAKCLTAVGLLEDRVGAVGERVGRDVGIDCGHSERVEDLSPQHCALRTAATKAANNVDVLADNHGRVERTCIRERAPRSPDANAAGTSETHVFGGGKGRRDRS